MEHQPQQLWISMMWALGAWVRCRRDRHRLRASRWEFWHFRNVVMHQGLVEMVGVLWVGL